MYINHEMLILLIIIDQFSWYKNIIKNYNDQNTILLILFFLYT